MRSKINRLANFTQAEFPKEVDLTCPEEYLQKKLRAVTRSRKRTEKVEVTEKGDAVVMAVESELPKFNRPMVQVAVGSGMYDRELEEQLVGRTVGETFAAQVQGKPVIVTVKQAARTVFPEPTDEMVAEYAAAQEGMEDVKTVADFRRWIQEQYREGKKQEAVYGGMQVCVEFVLDNSDWDIDEKELSVLFEESLEEERQNAAAEGIDFDTMTAEDSRRVFGVESREQIETILREGAEISMKQSLWLAVCQGLDPEKVTMDQVNQLDWTFLEEYVSGQITFIN